MKKEKLELPDAITTQEAIKILGISAVTLRKYVVNGYLSKFGINDTRIVRYSRNEVNKLFTLKKNLPDVKI